MTESLLPVPGMLIPPSNLRVAKARELAAVVVPDTIPYVHFIECRRRDEVLGDEVIVLEVEVELPQRKQTPIARFERVAVGFSLDDRTYPEVLALRPDFPMLKHLNQRVDEFPRSLCLYEEPYAEVRLHWTPTGFVERIRTWLARAASGELHLPDQPLEPLLIGAFAYLALPPDLSASAMADRPAPLIGYFMEESGAPIFFGVQYAAGAPRDAFKSAKMIAMVVNGKPQTHGVIRRTPQTLLELHALMEDAGDDLLGELRVRLQRWQADSLYTTYRDKRLLIIARLPKKRVLDGPIEAVDLAAFLCDRLTLKQVGEQIGVRERDHAGVPRGINTTRRGEHVSLIPLQPVEALSRSLAARLNGETQPDNTRILLVGGGAVGSQLFANLVRAGFGAWTIVDRDQWLPHNFARNSLPGTMMGRAKATAQAEYAAQIVGDASVTAVIADVLTPSNDRAQLAAYYHAADVILDTSASVAVARYLARDVASNARRASFFLSPSGDDAVMLVEDRARQMSLDHLEMEYYRAVVCDPALARHLEKGNGSIRYARACHDLTSRIPQDRVALFAATGSRAFRARVAGAGASITIWRATDEEEAVNRFVITPAPRVSTGAGGWTLSISKAALDVVRRARADKVPNETGGVLVGATDMQRRLLYVVDALLSPPDSEEWPTSYIRGCEGLAARIREIEGMTQGMLGYIGEWHSHPPGHGFTPSPDDRAAFAWLADELGRDGQPPLMLIVGDGDEVGWFAEQMP